MSSHMMTSLLSLRAAKRRRKRRIALCVILLFIVIYSVIWYILAHSLQTRVSQNIEVLRKQGITTDCKNLHKTGYPLKIGMACDSFTWSFPPAGFSFSFGRFVAAAPVFAPHWKSFSIEAPANIQLFGFPAINGGWNSLEINIEMKNRKLKEFSLASDYPVFKNLEANADNNVLAKADFIRTDILNISNKLQGRISFDNAVLPQIISLENIQIPALEGVIEFVIDDTERLFQPVKGSVFARLRGHTGEIKKMIFNFASGGKLTVAGSFIVNDKGQLSGKFDVAIGDSSALMRTLRGLFPSQVNNLEAIFYVLSSMPKNSQGEPIITFTIKNGNIRVGYIKLGQFATFQ